MISNWTSRWSGTGKLVLFVVALAVPAFAEDAARTNRPTGLPGQAAGAQKFFTPAADEEGLRQNTNLVAGLPNVLILGDSISIGYTRPVVERLRGKANVQRPRANCGDTPMGLNSLDQWLGNTRWDVIHFNWGLWDLCYRRPESKEQGNRDKVNGKLSVPLPEYEKNLEALVRRLEITGAKLIWASTTVVPPGEAGRFVGDEIKYNEAARRVMEKHRIPIDDLHALTAAFPTNLFAGPGNVHFTKEGYQKLAAKSGRPSKKSALPASRKQSPEGGNGGLASVGSRAEGVLKTQAVRPPVKQLIANTVQGK